MKKLMTIILAMVIFMGTTIRVEAKEMTAKEEVEHKIEETFDETVDEQLGVWSMFISERYTTAELCDDYSTVKIFSRIVFDEALFEEYQEPFVEYAIKMDLLTGEIISGYMRRDGKWYDLTEDNPTA